MFCCLLLLKTLLWFLGNTGCNEEAAEYTGGLTLAPVLLMIIAFVENKTSPFYIKDVYLPTWSTLRRSELESTRERNSLDGC